MKQESRVIRKTVSDDAVEWLNALPWHDSLLYEIRFLRPNLADQVILVLDLVQDWGAGTFQRAELALEDCRLAHAKMRWGVVCMTDGETCGVRC